MTEATSSAFERYEADIVARLQAFSRQSSEERRAATVLAVDQYVDALRDAEFAPEQVVIAIKRTTRRAGVPPEINFAERQTAYDWDLMTEQFVTRAILRFFQPGIDQR